VVFKGSFVTPLALLSVGLQLRFDRKKSALALLGLGLLYKLILTPADLRVVCCNFAAAFKVIQVAVLESAMAPIYRLYFGFHTGLKPRLSSMMIGFESHYRLLRYFLVFFGSVYLNVLMRVLVR
jgi:predicted permease